MVVDWWNEIGKSAFFFLASPPRDSPLGPAVCFVLCLELRHHLLQTPGSLALASWGTDLLWLLTPLGLISVLSWQ